MQIGTANGVCVTRHGDILFVTFAGLLTGRILAEGRSLAEREARRWPTKALVIDLRWAAQLMAVDEWDEAADDSATISCELRADAAIVVTPFMLQAAERHCVQAASRGVTWVPFLDVADALSWALGRISRRSSCGAPPSSRSSRLLQPEWRQ